MKKGTNKINSGSYGRSKIANLQMENFVAYFLYLQDFVCKCVKLCNNNMDLHEYWLSGHFTIIHLKISFIINWWLTYSCTLMNFLFILIITSWKLQMQSSVTPFLNRQHTTIFITLNTNHKYLERNVCFLCVFYYSSCQSKQERTKNVLFEDTIWKSRGVFIRHV